MDFAQARKHMVDGQLAPNRIRSKALLARFAQVPRELFVAPSEADVSYSDTQALMGEGRRMFQPLLAAHMVQAAEISPEDTVLVVAGGTGYLATVVAGLAKKVHLLEENGALLDLARRALHDIDCRNVEIHRGSPLKGLPGHKKGFDKVLIDAPVAEIPENLKKQVKNGGRLVAVVADENGILELTVFNKSGGTLVAHGLMETHGEILPVFGREERFVF